MKIIYLLLGFSFLFPVVLAEVACPLAFPESPLTFDLPGLSSVSFVGTTPKITQVEGNPKLKILAYPADSESTIQVVDGKLVFTAASCVTMTSSAVRRVVVSVAMIGLSLWRTGDWSSVTIALSALGATMVLADESCDSVIEVEIHGPVKSAGQRKSFTLFQISMGDLIHPLPFDLQNTWNQNSAGQTATEALTRCILGGDDVEAVRRFHTTTSDAGVYNYRNKVLMGMSQTRILNDPPSVTAKDDVDFDVPMDVVRPETDEKRS